MRGAQPSRPRSPSSFHRERERLTGECLRLPGIAHTLQPTLRLAGTPPDAYFASGAIKLPALTPSASAWKFSTTR
jgi:hypothetical protein